MQVTGSNSNQHILSIRFSADGFYFALLNPKAKEKSDSSIHHLYKVDESLSFTANLKHAIDELEWLNYQYKAVSIVIATSRFTLVPLDFFEDEINDDNKSRLDEIYVAKSSEMGYGLFSYDKNGFCYPTIKEYFEELNS